MTGYNMLSAGNNSKRRGFPGESINMSSEQSNQAAANAENLETSHSQGHEKDNNEESGDLLKTRIESANVVNFIENMVQAMGSVAAEHYGGVLPNQIRRPSEPVGRKYQSKTVAAIMQKLERAEKYPDLHKEVASDSVVLEWVNKSGCKQKDYYEELECAQDLTGFFAGHRHYELAIKTASKAIAMTTLHRRDDSETLAELNWVLAELFAASDNMDSALNYMRKCLAIYEPGADENSATYKELLSQLEETRQRNLLVAMA